MISCSLPKRSIGTYIFWIISFFITITAIRLFHECMHGVFSVLTGGEFGSIYVIDWILSFYPIFAISCSGGNPFIVTEGTLIVTWVVALIIAIVTSYPFLSCFTDPCSAANLSFKLFGVRIGAVFEMFGQAVYAMPNFILWYENDIVPGDGTYMYQLFENIGYPGDFQYIIAFAMLIGALFTLYWSIKCDPEVCGSCRVWYGG